MREASFAGHFLRLGEGYALAYGTVGFKAHLLCLRQNMLGEEDRLSAIEVPGQVQTCLMKGFCSKVAEFAAASTGDDSIA